VRGDFKFNNNQFPIQNYYSREVVRDAQGRLINRIQGQPIFTNRGDAFSNECMMK
jgi:branched-chain amino acid transport system substrate-binding protein